MFSLCNVDQYKQEMARAANETLQALQAKLLETEAASQGPILYILIILILILILIIVGMIGWMLYITRIHIRNTQLVLFKHCQQDTSYGTIGKDSDSFDF